ncbi:interferon-inducible GTPase 5-like [Paramacrobiotus metropolitanus]|uniref:interferon-inducible GTPase 5-like n=1 Tax=Paramacrobiotus metropolitanus TaxID=2943436 RepID=UPI002445C787|nr:interferon-inducible GTPase 5-like [Paramacrobiotus metropolitanus]
MDIIREWKITDIFQQFDTAELGEFKQRWQRDGVKGIIKLYKQKEHELFSQPLHIAIIGNSGAGKSTFVNAIRGLTADDPGAARTDCVETTREPTAYRQPGHEALVFWDLPGVGTPNFPQDEYLELVEFSRYDFFIIMCSQRFTGADMWLGQKIGESNRQFFFVRTKVRIDVFNDRRAHPRSHDASRVQHEIREEIKLHLQKNCVMAPIFLIDSYQPQRFDFGKLQMQLIEDFPALKSRALTMGLSFNFSENLIKEKIKILRSEPWKVAVASAAAAPIPFVSAVVDLETVRSAIVRYLVTLGLDDASLEATSRRTGHDLASLMNMVHGCFPPSAAPPCSIQELASYAPKLKPTSAPHVLKWVPVVGSMIGAIVTFKTLLKILQGMLDVMEDLALAVVRIELNAARTNEVDM